VLSLRTARRVVSCVSHWRPPRNNKGTDRDVCAPEFAISTQETDENVCPAKFGEQRARSKKGGLMDDTIDFDLTMPIPAADKERLKEDCKKIAELFEASATAMFEGQDGMIFHLEFDDAAKFGKFAEYLRAHGLLRIDRIQTKSDKVH